MVTSRNVSPFGYIALIGETKMTIYLTYAEDDSCTYDPVWTVNFMDLRKLNIGKRIELIDFSPNCEELIAVMNTGELTLWSVKKSKFIRKITQLSLKRQMPATTLRTFRNNQSCFVFSQPNNLLYLVDVQSERIKEIRPESEGFGKIITFQVDQSEQYLICAFSNNKVGIYSTQTAALVLMCDEPGLLCDGCFIDEAGCFITMLDETRTKANIYVLEWKYEVEHPPAVRRQTTD